MRESGGGGGKEGTPQCQRETRGSKGGRTVVLVACFMNLVCWSDVPVFTV